jgi:7-cyano-7-deazaguanine synthase
MSDTAIVLISGGMDSSVLLHHVARDCDFAVIHALSFHYGQRHAIELERAAIQAQAAGVRTHRVIDLAFMGPLLQAGSTLIAGGADVPNLADLDEEALRQPPTYVPNRNMMLLSMAAAYAEAQGAADVYYGAQAQDEYGYWDCTTDFLAAINGVMALNRRQAVTVHAPFVNKSKAEIVTEGMRLGVDFANTWTCYRGDSGTGNTPVACGTCPSCIERRQAFDKAGKTDPLAYAR